MISVRQAHTLVMQHAPELKTTQIPLQAAAGFILAEDIRAERDYPPFDRITHDGIAIKYEHYDGGARSFPVTAYAQAGKPQQSLANLTQCIEVATGAPLPEGCDTIIPYEDCTIEDGVATINARATVNKKTYLHLLASDTQKGKVILKRGNKIRIHEMAALAANGVASVPVYAKPSIGILATGHELVAVEVELLPHQIRRSNDIALQTSLHLNGFTDTEVQWVPDNKASTAKVLKKWLASKDIIIITGGVSKGSFDYVPGVLSELNVQKIFHRVAQKPGKPLWFGKSENGVLVFGLPGNPVSCIVCMTRYVLPALRQMSGATDLTPQTVTLTSISTPSENLTLFVPVRRSEKETADVLSNNTSGDFLGLLASDGFVELPTDAKGTVLPYYPWVVVA